MLRITTQTSPHTLTFLVEGKLIGVWAKELELAWKQAAKESTEGVDTRAKIVDLSETQFIDDEGRRVLERLHREGASFRCRCPLIDAIVSEITRGTQQNPRVQVANLNMPVHPR